MFRENKKMTYIVCYSISVVLVLCMIGGGQIKYNIKLLWVS
jgi:hypothetical protein